MSSADLGPREREQALARLGVRHYDVLVVGGGVTGAGIALDAAVRGLRVALVERRDWAAGTSSRSGKLIHGGLRYLERRDFSLVREALRERRLLLQCLAPHLARPIAFLYPLRHAVWERAYVGAGLALYDAMAGAGAVPRHRHLSRRAAERLAPGLRTGPLVGALRSHDVQLDDARHTVELVRTAAAHGVDAISEAEVVALRTAADGVRGARVRAVAPDRVVEVEADHVVSATGVWTPGLRAMAAASTGRGAAAVRADAPRPAPGAGVQASKGVHLLVPRAAIDSSTSLFVRAEDSVLFVRTWGEHWLIGTTDTPWSGEMDDPEATTEDVDYLLRNVNRVLARPLRRDDVVGVYAGLRPLVTGAAGTARAAGSTSMLSREHAVDTSVVGFTSVAGGKYTTYRVMAAEVVDAVLSGLGRAAVPTSTDQVPLLGARGLEVARTALGRRGEDLGLTPTQVEHLLGRYGSLGGTLMSLMADRPELAAPLTGAERYLAAEVVHAASHEGARHLDDVLARRTHVAVETSDHGWSAAPHAARLVAPVLGWDGATVAAEVRRYRDRVVAEQRALGRPRDRADHVDHLAEPA